MSETRSNGWQNWLIGALGTMLLLVTSMYVSSLNADVIRFKDNDDAMAQKLSDHGERLATVEETIKVIDELKQSMKELTNALNETNRRSLR
jgi:hypothetical protein